MHYIWQAQRGKQVLWSITLVVMMMKDMTTVVRNDVADSVTDDDHGACRHYQLQCPDPG